MAKLCIMVPRMFLRAHQAAVEERQAGTGHQQDQGGGDQHPGVVAGGLSAGAGSLCVLHGLLQGGDLRLRIRGGRLSAEPGQESPATEKRRAASLLHGT